MKLQLPTVTILIADCLNVNRAINVVEHCKSLCDFGAVKVLTSIPTNYVDAIKIPPLNSLIAYSIFMLTKANKYVETDFCLVVQRDGFIINASSWNNDWYNLDWISPLFTQYPKVGSGGFSLRSKKLMDNVAENMPDWDWSQKQADEIQNSLGYYEDGVICLSKRFDQFKFATPKQASMFAQGGNPDPIFFYNKPFGFHGVLNAIDHTTGIVSPVCKHENNPNCGCSIEHVKHLQQNEA